eukprot:9494071-Pyramimonas_sp.AAC.1
MQARSRGGDRTAERPFGAAALERAPRTLPSIAMRGLRWRRRWGDTLSAHFSICLDARGAS